MLQIVEGSNFSFVLKHRYKGAQQIDDFGGFSNAHDEESFAKLKYKLISTQIILFILTIFSAGHV